MTDMLPVKNRNPGQDLLSYLGRPVIGQRLVQGNILR